jgi:hypothetical protein
MARLIMLRREIFNHETVLSEISDQTEPYYGNGRFRARDSFCKVRGESNLQLYRGTAICTRQDISWIFTWYLNPGKYATVLHGRCNYSLHSAAIIIRYP